MLLLYTVFWKNQVFFGIVHILLTNANLCRVAKEGKMTKNGKTILRPLRHTARV